MIPIFAAQYSSLGSVTCFNNGSLSVSINLYSNWSPLDTITVYYTCWSQERNYTVRITLLTIIPQKTNCNTCNYNRLEVELYQTWRVHHLQLIVIGRMVL